MSLMTALPPRLLGSELCPPRHATRRRPERASWGPQIAEVATELGWQPADHQRLLWDVGCELESHRPAYREVLLSMGRQDAKTTSVLAVVLWRCLVFDPRPWGAKREQVLLGAQTQERAGHLLIREWLPIIEASPFGSLISDVYRKAGGHRIEFTGGSSIASMTSNRDGPRGLTKVGMVVLDEAYSHLDDTAEAAARATMLHRQDAQIWIMSNAGTDEAVFWRGKYDAGVTAVEADTGRGLAMFDWGARPDDDPRDPETWIRSKPLLASGAIDVATLAAELPAEDADHSTFLREYLNVWTTSDARVIGATAWARSCGESIAPEGGIHFALDANPERTWACIVASDAAGRVELLHRDHGSAWAVDWLAARKTPVAVDANGPCAHLIDELRRAGVTVVPVDGRELADAAQSLMDAFAFGEPFVRSDYRLDEAVVGVQKRRLGDRFALGRGNDITKDVSPIVAMSLARWAAMRHVEPVAPWRPWEEDDDED